MADLINIRLTKDSPEIEAMDETAKALGLYGYAKGNDRISEWAQIIQTRIDSRKNVEEFCQAAVSAKNTNITDVST